MYHCFLIYVDRIDIHLNDKDNDDIHSLNIIFYEMYCDLNILNNKNQTISIIHIDQIEPFKTYTINFDFKSSLIWLDNLLSFKMQKIHHIKIENDESFHVIYNQHKAQIFRKIGYDSSLEQI